ncbi:MAG: four helix bundle protein [Thermoanaerobaculia bacterium]|jgi:four helix bundle protein
MYRFEKLIGWQRAMDLVVEVYRATKSFPADERFGLTSQIRRASTSIALNIAEGCAARSRKEFAQFLSVSLRSQYELAAAIRIALRLAYLDQPGFDELDKRTAEVGRLVQGLSDSIGGEGRSISDAPLDPEVEADVSALSSILIRP